MDKSSKKILISIGHPAQVHQFKYIYEILVRKGYDVLFLCKEKEITFYLLDYYKINYLSVGKVKRGLVLKLINIPLACFEQYRIFRKFKPNIVISRGSIPTVWISYLLKIPHIYITDTESVGYADKIILPFVNQKLSSYSYKKDLGRNHFRFSGNIELFYLHANYYKPNNSIYKHLGINTSQKYVIVRFVSWDAHHDIGLTGITLKNKIKLVKEISKYCQVFITSEKELPPQLERYKISIPPEMMHDAIYYSELLVGESATMASEAAVLGIPAIYIDEVGRGYTDEEGQYGLVYNYKPANQEEAIVKAVEIVKENNKLKFKKRHELFLSEKVDPTKMVVNLVENYPENFEKLNK